MSLSKVLHWSKYWANNSKYSIFQPYLKSKSKTTLVPSIHICHEGNEPSPFELRLSSSTTMEKVMGVIDPLGVLRSKKRSKLVHGNFRGFWDKIMWPPTIQIWFQWTSQFEPPFKPTLATNNIPPNPSKSTYSFRIRLIDWFGREYGSHMYSI